MNLDAQKSQPYISYYFALLSCCLVEQYSTFTYFSYFLSPFRLNCIDIVRRNSVLAIWSSALLYIKISSFMRNFCDVERNWKHYRKTIHQHDWKSCWFEMFFSRCFLASDLCLFFCFLFFLFFYYFYDQTRYINQ